jgi:hypothetical protein
VKGSLLDSDVFLFSFFFSFFPLFQGHAMHAGDPFRCVQYSNLQSISLLDRARAKSNHAQCPFCPYLLTQARLATCVITEDIHGARIHLPPIYMQQLLKSQGLCRSIRALLSASSQISGAVQCRCVQNLPSNGTDYPTTG